MTSLVSVQHGYVWKYRGLASAEGVSLAVGKHPVLWWRTEGAEGFGGAVLLSETKAQIKGLFIHPEWRGLGYGRDMTRLIFENLVERGYEIVSVFTARPDVYEPWGFKTVSGPRKGTYYMEWKR